MNIAVQAEVKQPSAKQVYGQVTLKGRIESRRTMDTKSGTLRLTLIKTPAADEYSYPMVFEVSSKRWLGEVGDEITESFNLEGYPKSYTTKPDKETGEVRKINTAELFLRAIEE